ncbi:hypothetical protein [Stenotrophomonas sp. PSU-St15]
MTIIKRFAAPAAFPDTLILDIEPQVAYPAGNLLGAYRFKRSAKASAAPKAGSWGAFDVSGAGDEPKWDAASVVCTGQILAVTGQGLPNTGNLTFAAVVRQAYPDGSPTTGTQFFIGRTGAAAQTIGLIRGSGGTLAFTCGGVNVGIPADGGDRFELFLGTYNRATGATSIYRPRTKTSAASAVTAELPSGGTVRLSGPASSSYAGHTQQVWNCCYNRLLTTAEMDDLYASLKASLAVGGVEI